MRARRLMFELDGELFRLKYTGEQLRPLFQLPPAKTTLTAPIIPIFIFLFLLHFFFGGIFPQTPLNPGNKKAGETVEARIRRGIEQAEEHRGTTTAVAPATAGKNHAHCISRVIIIPTQISCA